MKYFKPGMIVPYPFDSYYVVIILRVLKTKYSQSFCLVLTDEGPVKEVWLYEDFNKEVEIK